MAESLCCSPETITTLLISYTSIQNLKIKKKKKITGTACIPALASAASSTASSLQVLKSAHGLRDRVFIAPITKKEVIIM